MELNREYFQNRIVAVKLTETSHTIIIFVILMYYIDTLAIVHS